MKAFKQPMTTSTALLRTTISIFLLLATATSATSRQQESVGPISPAEKTGSVAIGDVREEGGRIGTTGFAFQAAEPSAPSKFADEAHAEASLEKLCINLQTRETTSMKQLLLNMLDNASIKTFRQVLDEENIAAAVQKISDDPSLPLTDAKSRVYIHSDFYLPMARYLASDEFMEKARSLGREDVISLINELCPDLILDKLVDGNQIDRLAAHLAQAAKRLQPLLDEDGYVDFQLAGSGKDIGLHQMYCNKMLQVEDMAVMDEFLKHAVFSYNLPMVLEALIKKPGSKTSELLASLTSKLSGEAFEHYSKKPRSSLYMYAVKSTFQIACRHDIIHVVKMMCDRLGGAGEELVRENFGDAFLSGSTDTIAYFKEAFGNLIDFYEMLPQTVNGLRSSLDFSFHSTVPERFATLEEFVRCLLRHISSLSVATKAAARGPVSRKGPLVRDLKIRDERLKKQREHFIRVLRAFALIAENHQDCLKSETWAEVNTCIKA